MPTNVPMVIWVTRSPKNVRRIRGLNWLDASCRTTIVIEKVSPATVINEPAMTESTVRLPPVALEDELDAVEVEVAVDLDEDDPQRARTPR